MKTLLTPEAIAVLRGATCTDNKIDLNAKQLPRSLYEEVNEVLVRLGGAWVGGKTKAHVFPYSPPPELLEIVIESGEMPPDNPEAFFETSDELAHWLIDQSLDHLGDRQPKRILEPSAGYGKLALLLRERFPDAHLTVVELNPIRASVLRRKGFEVIEQDFLTYVPECPFDLVVMNPPFRVAGDSFAYCTHVNHAWSQMNPLGVLIAVVYANLFLSNQDRPLQLLQLARQHGWAQEWGRSSFATHGEGQQAKSRDVKVAVLLMDKTVLNPVSDADDGVDPGEIDEDDLNWLVETPHTDAELKERLKEDGDLSLATVRAALNQLEADPTVKSAKLKLLHSAAKRLHKAAIADARSEERHRQLLVAEEQLRVALMLMPDVWESLRSGVDDAEIKTAICTVFRQHSSGTTEYGEWFAEAGAKPKFWSNRPIRDTPTFEGDWLVSSARHALDLSYPSPGEILWKVNQSSIKGLQAQVRMAQLLDQLYQVPGEFEGLTLLLTPAESGGIEAQCVELPQCHASATTPEEVFDRLLQQVRQTLSQKLEAELVIPNSFLNSLLTTVSAPQAVPVGVNYE